MNQSFFPPPELELDIYRNFHEELHQCDEEQLTRHYHERGRDEGRRCNRLVQRNDFAALINRDMKTLEIGPFTAPVVSGPNVKYADVLDQTALRERARKLNLAPENVPHIDFVLTKAPLSSIDEDFDAVISSHCIEHQPNLIRHLLEVQGLLQKKRGRYFLLVPDKRYCFDRFTNESTIAEILDAHEHDRRTHSLRSVVVHDALATHNDPGKHWATPGAQRPPLDSGKIAEALEEWRKSNGAYIDVHAWYFMPTSFLENMKLLKSLGFVKLEVERLYHTRYGQNEFWAILKDPGEGE